MNNKLPEGGKILVPVDGSQSSKKALSYAIDVAKKCSANIALVHVIPHVAIMVPGSPEDNEIIEVALERSGEIILKECQEETQELGMKTTIKLLRGHIGSKIVKHAKDEGFDLIVMGNRGHSTVIRFLLGSVSNYVVNHAECPVIIVK